MEGATKLCIAVLQGDAGESLVTMCGGSPVLASITGALLRKHEKRHYLTEAQKRRSTCDDTVTENLKKVGCSTWKEVQRQFVPKLEDDLRDPEFVHGDYSKIADAYSVLVKPLLKRAQDRKLGDEMAVMLEYSPLWPLLHAVQPCWCYIDVTRAYAAARC